MHAAVYHSPLGEVALLMGAAGLHSLQFGCVEPQGDAQGFAPVIRWLDCYFAGQACVLPALDMRGTPFQRRVWQACLNIPYGETWTYGELAAAVGSPGAARAVGGALGRNPLLLMVPCHRVLPAGGGCGNYAAGSGLKERLLQWERIDKRGLWV